VQDFVLKKGDQLPFITDQVLDANSSAFDLSNATVSFKYRLRNGEDVTSGDAVITDAANGRVQYEWLDSDVSGAGVFYAEWEVYESGSRVLTHPRDRCILFEIMDDIS
tara:strand:+ start:118675 stop:118998 length:324 start_codon:yes stop_codon:yes gene_type:complete